MSRNSTTSSLSNFHHGNLKPWVYKIQNLCSETYLDIHEHSRELCCRPFKDLEPRKGLWEIKPFGSGYVVQRVDPGRPEQYCTMMDGFGDGAPLCVAPYPVAWRIEPSYDQGFEYVRIFWGTTKKAWDLQGGGKDNGRKVQVYLDRWTSNCRIWKLVPVEARAKSKAKSPVSPFSTVSLDAPPSYDGVTGEPGGSGAGRVVTEVTTVTTRTRYRA